MITIDLAKRYAQAFGITQSQNIIDKVRVHKNTQNSYDLEFYDKKRIDFETQKLSINTFNYKKELIFSPVLTESQGNIFAPPLLMTFSKEKSLINDEVADPQFIYDDDGRIKDQLDHEVVEYWGTKPWNIAIKGLLIDLDNRIYPSEEIRELTRFWRANTIVDVAGLQFIEKDIYSIVLKSVDFTPIEGFQDTLQFSFQAISFKNPVFILSNEED